MLDQEHVLWLYRPHPAFIDMTHLDGRLRERLRYKLRVTEIVLRRQLDLAQTQNTVRSADALQREINEIDRLTAQCDFVEAILHDLEDPLHLPTHVADFDTLADDLEGYARLFGRSDLFDESFLRGVPSPVPSTLPKQYHSNQLLRQLERAEPGRTRRLMANHEYYVAHFWDSPNRKPTATPMTELAYLEMRARFRLGTLAEDPTEVIYSRVTGRTIEKNEYTVEILDLNGVKERGRKPDFFQIGKLIGDFKNVGEQDYSQQMHDNFRIANANDVRVSPGLAGTGKWRKLDPKIATDLTPRFDLVVRVPWHPRGKTKVDSQLVSDIKAHGTGGEILELIDDPILED